MKKGFAILALAVIPLGCTAEKASETTTSGPSLSDPSLGPAVACMKIGPADEDPIMENLIELGFDISYSDDRWWLAEEEIGYASEEDDPFVLCTDPIALEPFYSERQEIIAAGGYEG